uniref:Uncharacterized protein n=1 Tax=Oryza sativa subsp. japonica TaxID=39947 RepID=Q6ASZ6_ORYSJ|nr:hypothetical protein [Oryza sativa Japonica Group]
MRKLISPFNLSHLAQYFPAVTSRFCLSVQKSPDEWPDGGGGGGNWLHFVGVSDLTLSGGDVIDGHGHRIWTKKMENLQALHFEDCQGISVMGNTLKNSHESHLKFTRCSHDKANYMRITSPEDSPDTTGVHVAISPISNLFAFRTKISFPFRRTNSTSLQQVTGGGGSSSSRPTTAARATNAAAEFTDQRWRRGHRRRRCVVSCIGFRRCDVVPELVLLVDVLFIAAAAARRRGGRHQLVDGLCGLLLSCSAALVIVVVVVGVVAVVVVGQLEQQGQRSYDQQRTSTRLQIIKANKRLDLDFLAAVRFNFWCWAKSYGARVFGADNCEGRQSSIGAAAGHLLLLFADHMLLLFARERWKREKRGDGGRGWS